jgi:hypothetical protein
MWTAPTTIVIINNSSKPMSSSNKSTNNYSNNTHSILSHLPSRIRGMAGRVRVHRAGMA